MKLHTATGTTTHDTREAVYSACGRYRFSLSIDWEPLLHDPVYLAGRTVQFIGLNPSTATESANDPTVKRCIEFSKSWGFSRMVMTNLFAFRATDPRDMMREDEPIGNPVNDMTLSATARQSAIFICCWGNHGTHLDRSSEVRERLRSMESKSRMLAMNSCGQPTHPLYLPGNLMPQSFKL